LFTILDIPNCFRQCLNEKPNSFSELEGSFFKIVYRFGILYFGHCDLPFDLAQSGGESFDLAQDREPVERLVEPFVICVLYFGISNFPIFL